jgi:hypothetical protein
MDIKIIDNFLPIYHQNEFKNILKDVNFEWYYFANADGNQTKQFQEFDKSITSYDQFIRLLNPKDHKYWYDIFTYNLEKHFDIKVKEIIRFRLVLGIPRPTLQNFSYGTPHIDFKVPHKTLIYYGNNNDAKTVFFKECYNGTFDFSKKNVETLVDAKQGRGVLFDGFRYHSVQPYSESNRLLLNLNFIPEE